MVYLNFLNLTCFSETGSRYSELQITEGIEDNSKIIFLISHQKHMFYPSVELCRRDGSNDGSQKTFLWRNFANYPYIISVIPSYLEGALVFKVNAEC